VPASGPELALKEWSAVCVALADGAQTVLLRKGGLREPVFRPRASAFLLLPTTFHNAGGLLQPSAAEKYADSMEPEANGSVLELRSAAELTGCWTTADPRVLPLTSELHIWSEELLGTRLRWRPGQPLTVMELRCFNLAEPLRLEMLDGYKGCFSWVDVGDQLKGRPLPKMEPALRDREFGKKQALLRMRLAELADVSATGTG